MKQQHLRRYGVLLGVGIGCGGAPDGALFTAHEPAAPPSPGSAPAAHAAEYSPIAASDERASSAEALPVPPLLPTQGRTEPVTPTQLLWSDPDDGEIGVHADREVMLQFSEPMNIVSVQAALTTTLPGEVSFVWEGGATLLRLRSSEPLAYADGAEAEALEFRVSILEAARSLSGNPLAPSTLSFQTLRRVQLSLEPSRDLRLTGVALASGPTALTPGPTAGAARVCAAGSICAGDLSAQSGGGVQVKSFLTFELGSLPIGAQLESAQLLLFLEEIVGDPFGQRGLGSLRAERTWFSRIDPSAFQADPDATVAVFSEGAEQAQSQDISWVIEEARERGLSQYRLTFPQTTNRDAANDLAVLVPERQRLALSYLIP